MKLGFINRLRSAARAFVNGGAQARSFAGAQGGKLFADWVAGNTSADAEIRGSGQKLLNRSRDLERNNDYQRAYLLACERNIIGAVKYDLRMDCGEYKFAKGEAPTWMPDRLANSLIETAWSEWGKKGTCTICGRYSWRGVKRMMVRAVARDGNFIARKIRGARAGNRFNFALQLWEIDHLDVGRFADGRDGSKIRFGIEYNADDRVMAYWMRTWHPGDSGGASGQTGKITRIPAEEIYHIFLADRVEQSIGYPAIISAMTRLRQLGMFEEAACVAARIGASKMGFFKTALGPNGEGGPGFDGADGAGNLTMDASPGTFEDLPQGKELDKWDPAYPNIETGDFRKAMLRGASGSLGMSYNTLGNDLESVNFSSGRIGLFEEREGWKMLQMFYDEDFYTPVNADWLESSILAGAINLPLSKFDKFNRPVFKARRWPFINPLDEIKAAEIGIALRVTSRRQIVEEGGGDIEEVFHDNLADENLAEDIGLELPTPLPTAPTGSAPAVGSIEPTDDPETASKTAPATKS